MQSAQFSNIRQRVDESKFISKSMVGLEAAPPHKAEAPKPRKRRHRHRLYTKKPLHPHVHHQAESDQSESATKDMFPRKRTHLSLSDDHVASSTCKIEAPILSDADTVWTWKVALQHLGVAVAQCDVESRLRLINFGVMALGVRFSRCRSAVEVLLETSQTNRLTCLIKICFHFFGIIIRTSCLEPLIPVDCRFQDCRWSAYHSNTTQRRLQQALQPFDNILEIGKLGRRDLQRSWIVVTVAEHKTNSIVDSIVTTILQNLAPIRIISYNDPDTLVHTGSGALHAGNECIGTGIRVKPLGQEAELDCVLTAAHVAIGDLAPKHIYKNIRNLGLGSDRDYCVLQSDEHTSIRLSADCPQLAPAVLDKVVASLEDPARGFFKFGAMTGLHQVRVQGYYLFKSFLQEISARRIWRDMVLFSEAAPLDELNSINGDSGGPWFDNMYQCLAVHMGFYRVSLCQEGHCDHGPPCAHHCATLVHEVWDKYQIATT